MRILLTVINGGVCRHRLRGTVDGMDCGMEICVPSGNICSREGMMIGVMER
jgi:hypothetical protein